MNEDDLLFEKLTDSTFTVSLPTLLKEKLDNHLEKLKYLHHPLSVRQFWLLNAIKEKLNRRNHNLESYTQKNLNLKLSQDIIDELNSLLALSQNTYSKKEWILEAIEEKIKEEKSMIKKQKSQKICNENNDPVK